MEKNKLVSNSQPKSLKEILNEILNEKRPCQAWKIFLDKKWVVNYELKIVRTRTEELVYHVIQESSETIENSKKILQHEKDVRFWIASMGVLFSCKIISFSNTELVVKFPSFFAHQDRRKTMRLRVTEQLVTVSIPMQWQGSKNVSYKEKTPFDISSGGFSFIATKDEAEMFKNGLCVSKIMVTVNGRPCLIEAKVVTIVTIAPTKDNGLFYESSKICFTFAEIEEMDQLYIDNFVMDSIIKDSDKIA